MVSDMNRSEQGILHLYVGDLHMHTTYSHGANTPLEMALASRNLGFDFIAIAEHNTVRASKDARDLVGRYGLNLLVFLAEEVGSSPSAHILGIGIRKDIPSGMLPEEICREIRRQGGYAFAAHPNWGLTGPRTPFWELGLFESLLTEGELDGFELVNSTKYASTHIMAGSEHTRHVVGKYQELQFRGLHFPIISGSDAHSVEELGGTKMFVFAAELGERAIMDAILAGRCVVWWRGEYYGPEAWIGRGRSAEGSFALHDELCRREVELVRSAIEGKEVDLGEINSLWDQFYRKHFLFVVGSEERRIGREMLRVSPQAVTISPGRSEKLEVRTSNPFPHSVGGKLSLVLPRGWNAEPSEVGLELGGSEASVHTFTISVPHTAGEELETVWAKVTFGEGREVLGGAVLHVIPPLKLESRPSLRTPFTGEAAVLVEVEAENASEREMEGELRLEVPSGWEVSPPALPFGPLEPGRKIRGTFTVRAGSLAELSRGYYATLLALVTGKAISRTKVRLGLHPCFRTDRPPVIDGDLEDWNRTAPIVLDREEYARGDWRGPEDLSASFYTMWDDEYFYIAAQVRDDRFRQPFTGAGVWMGDSVQFGIDADYDRSLSYGEDDGEYGLALTPLGPQVVRWTGNPGVIEAANLVVLRQDGATVYEAAIPWEEMAPLRPEVGKTVGFSLVVNDDDGDGRKCWLEWLGGLAGSKDPSLWGTLTFV